MKEKGITLVALVVTIIVLVILASVSINLVVKQNGIWNQAKQAQELSKIGEYKERIDLILTEEVLKSNLENREITITGLIERFEKESFIGSAERIDVEEVETKGTIRLITTDGYIYEVILDGEKLYSVSQGKEDGEPYPTIRLEQLPMQGIENEKIQIKATGEVAKGKETTGIAYVERIDNKEKRDYQEGGIIFEIEENGTYLFSVTTNKGKSRIGKIIINVQQPKDTIDITATPITATNKEVEVSIKYGETEFNNSDKYQYRIGTEGSWQTSNIQEMTIAVAENEIIVARYYDGKNSFKVQNYNVQNIDKELPENFEITYEIGVLEYTIKASTKDMQSGMDHYEYSINGITYQVTTENPYQKITGLIDNQNYQVQVTIKAYDKAGNIREVSKVLSITPYAKVYDYSYTGKYQVFTTPITGTYRMEVWGGKGQNNENSGGNGGYATGEIYLEKGIEFYVYVGTTDPNGWNGGGKGNTAPCGGGATDIRTKGTSSLTNWNELESIKSRIIIAGGGCGSSGYENGGSGGGITGAKSPNGGVAGTQTSGYALGQGQPRGIWILPCWWRRILWRKNRQSRRMVWWRRFWICPRNERVYRSKRIYFYRK